MSSASTGSGALSFEIKSAQLPLVALLLRSTDTQQLAADLTQRFGDVPDFFDNDPLLIDLSGVAEQDGVPDFGPLLTLLRQHRLVPTAFKGGRPDQRDAALAAGLAPAEEATWNRAQAAQPTDPVTAAEPTAAPVDTGPVSALVVDRPLRSGQQVYARGRDLVVLAMVNPGAEVIADGHIHVYAPLRGKAIAGARGNADARIFAQALEAELISIAGIYRTSDVPLPDNVRGKAAQVRLHSSADGDKLLLEPIL
jgi:septum site-determining protein MinC